MMRSRRDFLKWSVGTLSSTILITQGCTSAPEAVGDQADLTPIIEQSIQERSLRIAFTGIPKQFNPALYSILEEYQLGVALFDGLIWVDETLTPQPLLAKSWQASEDLLQWTFQLEEDVYFHHGTLFTATDVVATFEQLLNPETASPFRAVLRFVESVEALDDQTVRFTLSTANVELPLLLGAPQASIVPHDQSAQQLAKHPSGTGPFQFTDYVPRERLTLTRNLTYWGTDEAYVDRLEYQYMSYDAQVTALQNQEIDVIAQLSVNNIPLLQADPTLHIIVEASGSYQTIVMQATEPPFDDLRVRQALKHCADHEALRQQVLRGQGTVGNNTPIAIISPYWAALSQQQQNIAKAKELLAEAGYTKGLKLDLVTSSSRPGMMELATAFRTMAAAAGIDITVIRVPADVYWSDYGGKAPFHIGNWGFRPSIDETFMVAYHSTSRSNESKWMLPALDALIDQGRAESDQVKRKELYAQAQELLWEEGAVIIPYFNPVAMAMRNDIEGFILHPAGWLDFSTVQFK